MVFLSFVQLSSKTHKTVCFPWSVEIFYLTIGLLLIVQMILSKIVVIIRQCAKKKLNGSVRGNSNYPPCLILASFVSGRARVKAMRNCNDYIYYFVWSRFRSATRKSANFLTINVTSRRFAWGTCLPPIWFRNALKPHHL